MISSRPHRSQPAFSFRFGPIIVALSFGLVGALFGLHRLAQDTLKHIVTSDPSLAFQEVSDYLPVPRKLDWNVPAIQFLTALKDIRGPVMFITAALILLMLGVLFLWIVGQNTSKDAVAEPGATTPPDNRAAAPDTIAILDGGDLNNDSHLLNDVEQDGNIHLTGDSGADSGQVGLVAPADAHISTSETDTRSEVVDNTHHDSERESPVPAADSPADARPRSMPRPSRLFATLAYLAGIAALASFGVPPISQTLLRYYHTLGTLNTDHYNSIAASSVESITAIWMAAGLLLYALCVARHDVIHRLSMALLASVLFAFAIWRQVGLTVRALSNRYDWSPAILTMAPPYNPDRNVYGVPEGYYAAELLGSRLKLAFGEQKEQPARPMMLFVPSGAISIVESGFTEDGLTASEQSVVPVSKYLDRKHYETALSWEALKHLFNVATVHFDNSSAIAVCMTDMEKCPHLSQCGIAVRTMLFTCSASASNLALIDRWGDERLYAHPTRESQRLMGQLYERVGEKEKALAWYRRADMPKTFLARVQNEKALFHTGRLTGKLVLNGKPLSGVQVGAVPRRLNGLPKDLEPMVIRSRGELISFRPRGLFPSHHPRPYALRWISAASTTDAAGQFDIGNLTEGEYMLICTLPPSLHLQTPLDPGVVVTNAPAGLTVSYGAQQRDLGTIGITIHR